MEQGKINGFGFWDLLTGVFLLFCYGINNLDDWSVK